MLEDEGGIPLEVRELLDQMILEVQRTLDYYTSAFSMPQVTQIALAPMEQPVNGLMPYLSGTLGIPVLPLNINTILKTSQNLSEPLQAQVLMAVGAAMRVDLTSREGGD